MKRTDSDEFDDDVEDGWLGGQSRDYIANKLGVSGSTVSDNIKKKLVPKYGEENVKAIRRAGVAIWKSKQDPN